MKRFSSVLTFALVFVIFVGSWSLVQAGEKVPASKLGAAKTVKKKPNAKLAPEFAEITDDPKLPRVLLIGDSISIGYTLPVRKLLAGKANVHRIPANGGNTALGLEQLDAWLGNMKKPWDVIHFNWGLHDLKRMKNGKYDVRFARAHSPEEYAKNLETLVVRLKKTGATLIWATTTPVPRGAAGRVEGDEVLFNREAAKIMKRHGVKIDDLYGYITPKLAKAQLRKNVHFTPEGYKLLARQVADEILGALQSRKALWPTHR